MIEDLLNTYPRMRKPLTPAHEEIYVEEYKLNRGGKGFLYRATQKLESWMHRKIAQEQQSGSILELGAGSLNHVPYEDPAYNYDCIEPFTELNEDSPYRTRIRDIYNSLDEVPPSVQYDRIISVAVLEHLTDLPKMIAQSALLLARNGVFQAGIPSEGGFLWGLAWRMTTGISYQIRTGLDYGTVMRHEHVNTAGEIEAIIGYFYRNIRLKRLPTPFLHLSFYTYVEAGQPDITHCREYLNLVSQDRF